jgi:hypothetical protein
MDEIKMVFHQIEKTVRQKENYIPRNYKTVGGMWTVDTYKKGDVTLQVMDEGWTTRIFSPTISATDSGGNLEIKKGTINDFYEVLETLD